MKKFAAFISAAAMLGISCPNTFAIDAVKSYAAEPSEIIGDVNADGIFNIYDVLTMKQYLLDISNLADYSAGDVCVSDSVDVFDLCVLKNMLIYPKPEPEIPDPPPVDEALEFIDAPIREVDSSLPSQGKANLVIFYVDFPDCGYGSADMTAEQIANIAFGAEDESNGNYPFESMSAFYGRASKGAMELSGTVFRYTAKQNKSAYENDVYKVTIAEECFEAFREQADFSEYDADNDGVIDATLISVPTAAGDDEWWPCAGAFGDEYYSVDGVRIGHLITGNAQIESLSDYGNFTSSYLHEMGHCMGLPDYYLYTSDDYEGMHGSAGYELMDTDAFSDFNAFSKLMLGWYGKNQIDVFGTDEQSRTFELCNAQTNEGNCVIIPMNDLNGNYASGEYFILEYATNTGNNDAASMRWWQLTTDGIRIFHVKPEIYDNGWWKYFKYENGSDMTDSTGDGQPDDYGIRLIRLVNDGYDAYTSGAVINGSTSGFGWYDSNENESINPNITITVGELNNGKYSVTVSRN